MSSNPPPTTAPSAVAAITAAATLALYVATACRTVPFGDGGELIAAADCLGVAHPPGYPLYTLLGWLVLRVPLGEPAFRMNLVSGGFAAAACAGVSWLIYRWTTSRVAALSAALAFALSSTWASVAVVAEVYSLHILAVILLLGAASVTGTAPDPEARARAMVAAGCALGVGLSHHPTVVLALPAAAVLAARGGGRGRPGALLPAVSRSAMAAAAAAAMVIPLVLYGTLSWRARLDPPSNWGSVTTVAALVDHVRAVDFRFYDLGWSGLRRVEGWATLGTALTTQLSLVVIPLAVVGFVGLPRRVAPVRVRLAAGALAVPTALFGLRYATADVEVFYLPLFLALSLAAGLGLGCMMSSDAAWIRAAGIALAVALVGHTAARNLPSRDYREVDAAALHARDILSTLPPDSVLFVETMESFGVLYLTQVLGERPDVTVYHRNGIIFRDLVDDFRVDRAVGEPPRAYRIRNEQLFIAKELTREDARPILFLGWPGYVEIPPVVRIEPVGLVHHVRLETQPPLDPRPVWERYHSERVERQSLRTGDPVALGVAASYRVAQGERALFEGDPAEAARRFQQAGALAGRAAGIHSYIGTVYGRYGELPRAIEWFQSAVDIRPTFFKAWNNLAMAYERSGQPDRAREALRRSLEIEPRQPGTAADLERLEGRGDS